MFIPDPIWLGEAYTEPINRSDTGYVSRNLWCRDKVCSLIEASQLDGDGTFLDYAAGYGMFVRLMRDSGYDFRWFDPSCQNLFSQGFEAATPLAGPFEAVTAFEVLEHLSNPVEEIRKIVALTPTFIFSTTLCPELAPQPADWWYYGFNHGQHIAFYTSKSLESLASQFGYKLISNGADFHVLSQKAIRFEITTPKRPLLSRYLSKPRAVQRPKRPALTKSDHETIVRQMLKDE